MPTIEEFEPLASQIKTKPGVIEVTGSERTMTVKWDPSKVDEAGVRKYLADAGRPVK
jgi:allophanate hydrolase subunit 1